MAGPLADDATMAISLRTTVACLAAGLALVTAVPQAVLATASPAAETYRIPADGTIRITGSGWGHGRGLSQWGAHEAASQGVTHESILAFYYPGTVLAALPDRLVRVLLTSDTGANLIVRATRGLTARKAGLPAVVLPVRPKGCTRDATAWRARATATGMQLDAYCGQWRTIEASVGRTLSFRTPSGIVSTQNGTTRRAYRGAITAQRLGPGSVQVINTVRMEQYLRSVVAWEVSPSWPMEALKAQAVAARTYAAREAAGRTGSSFDVYDSTRSQAYRGMRSYTSRWATLATWEHPRTDEAVSATARRHVTVAGAAVLTQFGASNGGATAASPLPHMTVAADPWDVASRNPKRSWTHSTTATALGSRLGVGRVTAIEVLGREGKGPWGGRVSSLRVVGTSGSRVLTGDGVRIGLGTSSSMLTFVPPA